jgi:hypothetical protein
MADTEKYYASGVQALKNLATTPQDEWSDRDRAVYKVLKEKFGITEPKDIYDLTQVALPTIPPVGDEAYSEDETTRAVGKAKRLAKHALGALDWAQGMERSALLTGAGLVQGNASKYISPQEANETINPFDYKAGPTIEGRLTDENSGTLAKYAAKAADIFGPASLAKGALKGVGKLATLASGLEGDALKRIPYDKLATVGGNKSASVTQKKATIAKTIAGMVADPQYAIPNSIGKRVSNWAHTDINYADKLATQPSAASLMEYATEIPFGKKGSGVFLPFVGTAGMRAKKLKQIVAEEERKALNALGAGKGTISTKTLPTEAEVAADQVLKLNPQAQPYHTGKSISEKVLPMESITPTENLTLAHGRKQANWQSAREMGYFDKAAEGKQFTNAELSAINKAQADAYGAMGERRRQLIMQVLAKQDPTLATKYALATERQGAALAALPEASKTPQGSKLLSALGGTVGGAIGYKSSGPIGGAVGAGSGAYMSSLVSPVLAKTAMGAAIRAAGPAAAGLLRDYAVKNRWEQISPYAKIYDEALATPESDVLSSVKSVPQAKASPDRSPQSVPTEEISEPVPIIQSLVNDRPLTEEQVYAEKLKRDPAGVLLNKAVGRGDMGDPRIWEKQTKYPERGDTPDSVIQSILDRRQKTLDHWMRQKEQAR